MLATSSLNPNEVQSFIRSVLQVARRSTDADDTALAFAQKVVQFLFKTTIQTARELYVLLLTKLCEDWSKVAKEVIDWLLYSEDEVRRVMYDRCTDSLLFSTSASSTFRPLSPLSNQG